MSLNKETEKLFNDLGIKKSDKNIEIFSNYFEYVGKGFGRIVIDFIRDEFDIEEQPNQDKLEEKKDD